VWLSAGLLGFRLKIRFELVRIDEATHDFEFRGYFPLGITMQEHITVRAVDGGSRVQYG
jgi:hypothetical protein